MDDNINDNNNNNNNNSKVFLFGSDVNNDNPSTSTSGRHRGYGAMAATAAWEASRGSAATTSESAAAGESLVGARTVHSALGTHNRWRRPSTTTTSTTSIPTPSASAQPRNVCSSNSASDAAADDDDDESGMLAEPERNSDSDSDSDPDDMPPQTTFLAGGSRRRLAIAYAGLLLVAFTTSLEAQVTAPLAAFAVSSFQHHSLLSTVYVVQGVINAVIKPPMAKMADVFGRFEAFLGAVLLCVTGYVQMACSRNVQTFAAAQILYSAGITGLQVLQQIFVADTSDFRHRALLSSLPDTPFLITVWIGPSMAAAILAVTSWRWGYALWAFILPLAFLPLGASLAVKAYQTRTYRRQRRRSCLMGLAARPKSAVLRRHGHRPSSSGRITNTNPVAPNNSFTAHAADQGHAAPALGGSGKRSSSAFRQLLVDLDAVGILLLTVALSLVLLPLTLAGSVPDGWSNPAVLVSIVVGCLLLLVAFPAWEARPDWAPHPLIPPTLLRSTTFCAGCGVAFFFFAVFYMSVQPYFYSYLLVAHNRSVAAAGRITQIFSFTSTIAAVGASVAIRHLRRYKVFVVTGACVYLAGVCLMLRYRTADAGTAWLVATQIAVGAGGGLMSVPTQIGVQASVSSTPLLVSAATAVYLTMGEAGSAVGAAISGALWGRLVPAKLEAYLPAAARQNASAIYSSVVVATSYPWGSPERAAIVRAYQESMTSLLLVAVVFCVPVLVLALLMRDYRFEGNDSHSRKHGHGHGHDHTDLSAAATDGDDDYVQEGAALLDHDSNRVSHQNEPSAFSSNANIAYTVNEFNGTVGVGERTILLAAADAD
ncbi:siderochrome-iron transporter [Niveomyces insectorum RCEF 264]|uniref:Siderochrome-iron transporter n=1 Tax=Niveomyces insectorum RCEF 264 TaxID=1081102 RepID=A0A167MA65_9HYPO|nr:siderochrome-iron transporter [Niveomyces insectorum RCEF 264]